MNTSKKYTQGFSLIEMLAILAIIGLLVAISVPGLNKARKSAAVTSVIGTVQHVQSAVQQFVQKANGTGYPPITNSGSISAFSLSGTNLLAATPAVVSKAATLDMVLLTERFLESPISVGLGSANNSPAGALAHPLLWNTTTNSFYCSPDAAPDYDYTAVPHLLCQLSTAAVPGTDGSNFYLDASLTALPTNARVVSLMLPGVQGTDAAALANQMDNKTTALATAANTLGRVTYAAPSAATGITTVYVYVAHY